MTPWKLGLGLNTGMMIDRGMTTAIDPTEIDVTIIGQMISMMMTDLMSTIGIITTATIHQEMTGGHTRVIGITMIEEGMMITYDDDRREDHRRLKGSI